MLKEFYNFIANRINSYFQKISSDEALLCGETFCLKLDTEEMVVDVAKALQELVQREGTMGEFVFPCANGMEYKTFTMRLMKDELIIAPQINGMTSDFLCATLRNAANSSQKPILMISSELIDSAISGSKNMSVNGMPFYGDELMKEIRGMFEKSTQLTHVEKRILSFELERRDTDVFSDKASLYEYRDLLAIMSLGKIQKENFVGFRLFYIDGKTEYFNEGESSIDRKIKNNNEIFEKIDRCFRFGNASLDLAKDFDDRFIKKMEEMQRKDPENWSQCFTYAEILMQMEKHKSKMENPLKIEKEDICVYGEMPIEIFEYGSGWIIRNEGSQNAKKRKKNIIIFNPDKKKQLHIRFCCNAKVNTNDVFPDELKFEKDGKDFIFEINSSDILFKQIELCDGTNHIKYVFKICIVDLSAASMISVIKHCYTIDLGKKNDNRIKLSGIGTDLIFNDGAPEVVTAKLDENESYFCAYNQRLHLHSTEDDLCNFDSGIRININFAGIDVPFIMVPDESKSREITGRAILREKYATGKSFEFIEDKIYSDTQEYFAKTNLLRELRIEKCMVEEGIAVGKCKHFYDTDQVKIEKEQITQDQTLYHAFEEYLIALNKAKTIPTLAYLGEELLEKAKKYVEAFIGLYSKLEDGDTLTLEQVNALYIGTISVGNGQNEILLTPFHPINVAYQVALTKEIDIGDVTDVVIDRLCNLTE